MKTLQVHEKDLARAKEVLKANGIPVSFITPAEEGILKSETGKQASIRMGKRKAGTSLADFSGIWGNDDRTLASIREKAWPKRK